MQAAFRLMLLNSILLQVRLEEIVQFFEGDFFQVVVEVHVGGSGDDEEFLVADGLAPVLGGVEFCGDVRLLAGHLFECAFAEVAAVGLFAVDDEHGVTDFVGVREELGVHERGACGGGPALVAVEGALVIAARGLVVGVVILDKVRSVVRERVNNTAGQVVRAVLEVLGALGHQSLAGLVAGVGVVCGIEVAVCCYAAHVVHGRGNRRLYAGVDAGSVNRHAAPAANADDADAFRVNVVAGREEIHGRHEVFGVDVRAVHVARLAARFAGETRVERNGQESAFRHLLGVKAAGLFLDGTERARDCNRGELAVHLEARVLGHEHVGGEFNAKMVLESDLGMFDLVALGENLIPFGGERKLVHIFVLCLLCCGGCFCCGLRGRRGGSLCSVVFFFGGACHQGACANHGKRRF